MFILKTKVLLPILNRGLKIDSVYDPKNDSNLDKKYFKYDSLNHLADQPGFEENDLPYGIMADILCYFDFLKLMLNEYLMAIGCP